MAAPMLRLRIRHHALSARTEEKNPEIERGQREGRAIFWDKDIDADLYKRYEASDVPQPAYVYGSRCRKT